MTMELDKKAVEAAAEKICCPNGCTRKVRHDPCIAYTVMDVAEDALRAYEAAKWRPIETFVFPVEHGKDSDPVIIWDGTRCAVAHATVYKNHGRVAVTWWIDCSYGFNEDGEIYDVTHWMPLPPSPDDKEG